MQLATAYTSQSVEKQRWLQKSTTSEEILTPNIAYMLYEVVSSIRGGHGTLSQGQATQAKQKVPSFLVSVFMHAPCLHDELHSTVIISAAPSHFNSLSCEIFYSGPWPFHHVDVKALTTSHFKCAIIKSRKAVNVPPGTNEKVLSSQAAESRMATYE